MVKKLRGKAYCLNVFLSVWKLVFVSTKDAIADGIKPISINRQQTRRSQRSWNELVIDFVPSAFELVSLYRHWLWMPTNYYSSNACISQWISHMVGKLKNFIKMITCLVMRLFVVWIWSESTRSWHDVLGSIENTTLSRGNLEPMTKKHNRKSTKPSPQFYVGYLRIVAVPPYHLIQNCEIYIFSFGIVMMYLKSNYHPCGNGNRMRAAAEMCAFL